MKTVTLEYKSVVTYRLVVEVESKEEALEMFSNDELNLNEATESDSETDFDNVKIIKIED